MSFFSNTAEARASRRPSPPSSAKWEWPATEPSTRLPLADSEASRTAIVDSRRGDVHLPALVSQTNEGFAAKDFGVVRMR